MLHLTLGPFTLEFVLFSYNCIRENRPNYNQLKDCLWLTTEPTQAFPIGILQRSLKVCFCFGTIKDACLVSKNLSVISKYGIKLSIV